MKKIYLVDVSSMFFRAYYAVRPLTSPSGLPVNAIYGFLSMIIKLLKDEKPEFMVFCYDRKEPSFRKELYDDYKANRTEMPDDLALQIPYIKKLADLLGVPSLEVEGYEADDIIGTLTRFGQQQNLEVVIVSGDKDFGQLIQEHTYLYDTMKNVKYDSQGVFEKWGIRPDQFIDYLAIVGDTSDNVPGVKGIGEKGALKLLQQFKDLEDIYAKIDQVDSKSIKEKLIAAQEMAFLSKRLVTIVCDVPLKNELNEYRLRPIHQEDLRALLRELNFKSFEKSLLGEEGQGDKITTATTSPAVQAESTTPHVAVVAKPVTPSEPTPPLPSALAIEEKVVTVAELLPLLKAGQQLWAFHHPRFIAVAEGAKLFVIDGELTELGPATDRLQIQWVGFDLKNFWHRIGAQTPQVFWDTQLASYVLKAESTEDFAKVLKSHLQLELPELASTSQIYQAHLDLFHHVKQSLEAMPAALKVYQELDLPLAKILLQMERRGIALDIFFLSQQSTELSHDVAVLEKNIHELAGEKFNVASPKQLAVILFEKLGLPAGKKTKTGYSTDNEVLQSLEHPIAKQVLQFRELSKLKSTYVDALPALIHPQDGRLHTHFHQALTTTGRLSSSNPNLQNIPIRTERGQQVRRAFIAEQGQMLLSADYSQIELRILAHISNDPGLCRAFAEDLDIHAATAAEIYGVPLKDVTSDLRRAAKAVNFGIAYGQGAFGLAENLGISRGEAQDIIKRYFQKFKGVQDYIEGTIKKAHEDGYVETLFGRRRYIEELTSKNAALRKFGERAAINAPIQGTAADLVKKAMIVINDKVAVPMLLQVHDELIFEASQSELEAAAPQIVQLMEGVANLKVPLKVNYSIGKNWDEAH